MVRFSRVGVLVVVMALSGLLASSAGAAEWHTNGHKVFSSTNAGATRLILDPSGTLIECSGSTVNGTLRGPTFSGATFPAAGTVTLGLLAPCSISGMAGFSIACSPGNLNGLTYTGGTTFATAGNGVTTGSITSIDCKLSVGATTCSTITGTAHVDFINPNPIATGASTLTVTKSYLGIHKIGAGCALFPDGTVTLGKPDAGSGLTDIRYVVDGPNAPYIYRTP